LCGFVKDRLDVFARDEVGFGDMSNLYDIFGEWLLAVGVALLTFLAGAGTRAFLKRIRWNTKTEMLRELAPAVGHLVYLVGLKLFIEVAPLGPTLEKWLGSAIFVLTVVVILNLIRRAAMMGILWSASRSNSKSLHQGFIPLMRNVLTLFVFFTGAIMVLQHFNYDVLSLLTALGVGSLAVGLAAKDTLSNMISGFTVIIDRNLRPGDRVNLGGSVGDVEEIGLRSTRIRVGDGNTLIVPNSELVNTKILNLSLGSREVATSTSIRVPLTVPFPRIRDLCAEAMGEIELIQAHEKKCVNLLSIADGAQLITVSFSLSERDDSGAVLSELNQKLLARLQGAGIPLVSPPS
jgi:MscS family membrane protein